MKAIILLTALTLSITTSAQDKERDAIVQH
jgi:hypothetical protein